MSDDSDGSDETLWWGHPIKARRFHVFEGEGRAAECLCSAGWILGHDGRDPEVDPEDDEFTPGEDCKECARKAGVLDEGDA